MRTWLSTGFNEQRAEKGAEDKGFSVNTYQDYLDTILAPVLERSDVLGYGLLTLDGVVLAGSTPSDRGKKITYSLIIFWIACL